MGRRRKPKNPSRAIGYVRVSTEEQSLGPAAQRAALERWASIQDVKLVALHEDHGVSGSVPVERRPGLMAALADLTGLDAGVLLVAKRDRLARDVVVAATTTKLVEAAGARIVSADGAGEGTGPEAQLMRTILDAFAQFERALIRSRTAGALAAKKAKGEKLGGSVPYGYRLAPDGVHLAPEPAEQKVVARVRRWRRGGASVRAIAEKLSAARVPARGKTWHPTSVFRILARAAAPGNKSRADQRMESER